MEIPAVNPIPQAASEPVPDTTHYRGLAITLRTFQINRSGFWTLDITIASRVRIRSFSRPETYATRAQAAAACRAFGRSIIDGTVANCSVRDL